MYAKSTTVIYITCEGVVRSHHIVEHGILSDAWIYHVITVIRLELIQSDIMST